MYDATLEISNGARFEIKKDTLKIYDESSNLVADAYSDEDYSDVNTSNNYKQAWIVESCSDVLALNTLIKQFTDELKPSRFCIIIPGIQTWFAHD